MILLKYGDTVEDSEFVDHDVSSGHNGKIAFFQDRSIFERSRMSFHPMVNVPDAIRIILKETRRVCHSNIETVPADHALHRTLASDVRQRPPGYPPYRASIMDGYALRSSQNKIENVIVNAVDSMEWTHRIVDRVLAGATRLQVSPAHGVAPSADQRDMLPSAVYVATGAMVPDPFDCVVPIEQVVVDKEQHLLRVSPSHTCDRGKWIRPIGCDIPPNSIVVPAGHNVDGIAMGLILQSGVDQVDVLKPVTVGVLSTGDELSSEPWDQRRPGTIPDVNRPILLDSLRSWGFTKVKDLGVCGDSDSEGIKAVIHQATDCQVILTTGGISVGEADVMEKVLLDCGTLHFGRLNMKPGKPTTFFTLHDDRLVFALPGNPVSAVVCASLLVWPALHLLFTHSLGAEPAVHSEFPAVLVNDIDLDPERPEYARVTVDESAFPFRVSTTGVQRSSRLISCLHATGLLVLPQGTKLKSKALAGESYTVLRLDSRRHKLETVLSSKHLNPLPPRTLAIQLVYIRPNPPLELSPNIEELFRLLNQEGFDILSAVQVSRYDEDLEQPEYTPRHGVQSPPPCIVVSGLHFPAHTQTANVLLSTLEKLALTTSCQIRQNASQKHYEVVVGVRRQGGNL